MGYYTYYNLTLENASREQAKKVEDRLKEMDIIDDILDEMYDSDGYFSSCDSAKWYEHEEDIGKLSMEFPEVHFVLQGEGDNRDDIWEKHFINGRIQRCHAEIVYPSFSPNKLTPIFTE